MNGERTFGEVIPNDKLSALMNVLFNVWFKKWREEVPDETGFLKAFDELETIMRQGDKYPVVSHLCISLIYELDARMHGGYTETSRDKLLALIRQEGKMT